MKRISIRIARLEDANKLLEIYRPYVEQTAITFEYEVPSLEEFTERMKKILKKYPYLVAEVDGEIAGYAYASAFHERAAYDWSVETSIYLNPDKKRLGIGRRLYDELERILKQQNITNVNACIACPETEDEYLTNDSIRFHERYGYQMVGKFHQCGYKFNRWYHMVWMERQIGEHLKEQPKVIWFPDLQA